MQFTTTSAVDVSGPTTAENALDLNALGEVRFQGLVVELDELKTELQQLRESGGANVQLLIRAHPDAPPGKLQEIVALAEDAGITAIDIEEPQQD